MVAKIARIPPKQVSSSDKELLRNLERDLKMTVFGQDEAIDTISAAIKLSRAGLKGENKPIGSFMFAGPTGVGKTEVSRQLARALGVELVRFDMAEYMERHTVSRLIGAPPGYVGYDQGGLLTEAITKTPHCVLLLDEIEKAHPEVFNILLQVMDNATLTDNNGRKADFRNVILIMTTNAGAEVLNKRSIGFTEQDQSTDGMEVLKKAFTPEFRNRLDGIVQFAPLTTDVILGVVDKFLVELQAQLDEKGVVLNVDAAARSWLDRAAPETPDSTWVCAACGTAADEWSAVCGQCGQLQGLRWRPPPRLQTPEAVLPGDEAAASLSPPVAVPAQVPPP